MLFLGAYGWFCMLDSTHRVIFLDDLQWMGAESYKLLETILLDPRASNLIVIAAHRPVDCSHPAKVLIQKMGDNHVAAEIRLGGLCIEEVTDFVSDLLSRTECDLDLQRMADVVCKSTNLGQQPPSVLNKQKDDLLSSLMTFFLSFI